MCWNCGCMNPDDDHGNPNNITTETLRRAAQAGGQKSVHEVIQNMNDCHDIKVHDTPADSQPVGHPIR